MGIQKKERWTEAEVVALPPGEHDYFDRKSGKLLLKSDFRHDLAKALSAFANSGGGHLILGVSDDGKFDGVEPSKGNTPTREWLEQIIPQLLDNSLEDFRVHEIEPSSPSSIPHGEVGIVVDVGDSILAPHQSRPSTTYFYRVGGHSKPAPHHYLEALRNRLVGPALKAEVVNADLQNAYLLDGRIFVHARLRFKVTNVGRVVADRWELVVEEFENRHPQRITDYYCYDDDFPERPSKDLRSSGDMYILPSLDREQIHDIGVHLYDFEGRRYPGDEHAIKNNLVNMAAELRIVYRVVSEISRGESLKQDIGQFLLGLAPGIAAMIDEETDQPYQPNRLAP